MATFFPKVGTWYQELGTGQRFEIVAVDEKYGSIEVQYQDGDMAEYDPDSWGHLDVTKTSAPTEGLDPYAESPFESDMTQSFIGNPLEDIEPDSFGGFDDLF